MPKILNDITTLKDIKANKDDVTQKITAHNTEFESHPALFALLREKLGEADIIPGDNIVIDIIEGKLIISAAIAGGDNPAITEILNHKKDSNAHKDIIPQKVSQLQNDSQYISSVPIATSATLGGVKVGENLSITSDGTLSANASGDVGAHNTSTDAHADIRALVAESANVPKIHKFDQMPTEQELKDIGAKEGDIVLVPYVEPETPQVTP